MQRNAATHSIYVQSSTDITGKVDGNISSETARGVSEEGASSTEKTANCLQIEDSSDRQNDHETSSCCNNSMSPIFMVWV